MSESTKPQKRFTAAWPISTESGRTGLVTCKTCGAVLILDPKIDWLVLHDEWHKRQESGS